MRTIIANAVVNVVTTDRHDRTIVARMGVGRVVLRLCLHLSQKLLHQPGGGKYGSEPYFAPLAASAASAAAAKTMAASRALARWRSPWLSEPSPLAA